MHSSFFCFVCCGWIILAPFHKNTPKKTFYSKQASGTGMRGQHFGLSVSYELGHRILFEWATTNAAAYELSPVSVTRIPFIKTST
jgi:hypothetical protein